MAEANPEPPVMFAETSSTITDQYPLANVIMESHEIITKETAIAIEVKAEDEEKDVANYTPKLEATQPDDMSNLKPGERVRCNECHRYTAENMEQLLRHVRKVHRGQNPFQCYMCDYSTYNKPLFEEHVRIHKGIKPFKCTFCPYKSASKKNAKKHELIHRPNNPLKCPACPFIARHVRSLNCHRREHAKGKTPDEIEQLVHDQEVAREKFKHICDNCGADFAVARNLASHQRATKKCEECDLVLCSKVLYKKHMACEHSKEVEEEVSFHCALCPWKSSTKTRILLHLIHHPNQEVDDDIDIGILRKYGIME